MKILVLSHGHPKVQKGGGEIAAYAWFKELRSSGHRVAFLGWGGSFDPNHSKTILQEIGTDDYLIYSDTNFLNFSVTNGNLYNALDLLVRTYQPDIVHLHHYIHLGIEAAAVIKKLSPQTRVILTLHEYLAICHNNGQLMTTGNDICRQYKPSYCSQCFPTIDVNAFFLRELSIKAAFSYIDDFIAPSQFLLDQYVKWGIPSTKIVKIENPFPMPSLVFNSRIMPPENGKAWKLGFFGQINFYKGLDVVIEGVRLATLSGTNVTLDVHGKISSATGEEYANSLKRSVQECEDFVTFNGMYESQDVLELMGQYHFVIMGSRWYENSPVVIQEAIEANRPLIVPNLGGMGEKVKGLGLLYRPGDPTSLHTLLKGLTTHLYSDVCLQVEERRQVLAQERYHHKCAVIQLYGIPVKSDTQ